jgi:hypothetical protein
LKLFVDNKIIELNFDFKSGFNYLKKIVIDEKIFYRQNEDNLMLDVFQSSLLPRIEVDIFNVDAGFFDDEFLMSSDFEKVSFIVLYSYLKNIVVNKYNTIPNEDFGCLKELVIYLVKNKKNISDEESARSIMLKFFINSKSNSNYFFEKLYDNLSFILDLLNIFKLDDYLGLLDEMDQSLNGFYSSIRYLEPLRATAQRYYRAQELSIDEIDSKGSNVPMFLDNLTSFQSEQLKKFINKHFSISVNVKKEGGHLALTIINPKDGVETNIADLGVGYSQILPFLVQFWDLYIKAKRRERMYLSPVRSRPDLLQRKFLLIEQPELHLHPAYQVKTVDMIVDLISSMKSKSLGIIMETHSPNIIYRLSELIESEQLNSEDVQILIFDENDGETNIVEAHFDSDGDLINWPSGFFQV